MDGGARVNGIARWALAALVALGSPAIAFAATTPAAAPALVFLDNDFSGPGDSNVQSLVPLLHDDAVTIVGLGVVTGDAWRNEEAQSLLRVLEIAGRPDIPVYLGAEMPLLRTPTEMHRWVDAYGKQTWLGAFTDAAPGQPYHPSAPEFIPPMAEGTPKLAASHEDAVAALIRLVRANPGKITIVAAGPLTDIALAVRIAPDLPALAKAIVIEGGNVDDDVATATAGLDAMDFNFFFDPEAAHIVLTSPWPRIVVLSDASRSVIFTKPTVAQIATSPTPLAHYLTTYAHTGEPMWDEITTAVAADPTLITKEAVVVMDVDTMPGMHYGRAQIWSDAFAPKSGAQHVHLVLGIDGARFLRAFTAAARK